MIVRTVSALALALALTASSAAAQSSSEVAAARALFREGLAAARAGRWQQALERFERSYAIAPRDSTLLNLAGAQVQTGRLVEGAESYRRFLAEAHGGGRRGARYRRQAREALEQVEGRLGRLVLRVEGGAAGDDVLLDDDPLAPAALGVEVPVNPGAHTVVVRRGDTVRARETFEIDEGERREVTVEVSVDLQVATEGDAGSAPAAALRSDPEAEASSGDDSGVWIGVGVGVGVLAAVGVALGVALAVDAENATYTGNLGPGAVTFE